MQKFIVPQFIDIENKILGPITVRQFVVVAIGGALMFVAYRLADFSLFLIEAVVILMLSIVIGFIKFNGLPFHIFIINLIGTYKKPMLRVWLKETVPVQKSDITDKKKKGKKGKDDEEDKIFIPKRSISSEKLSELSLIIDTGGVYKGEAEANKINKTLYNKVA